MPGYGVGPPPPERERAAPHQDDPDQRLDSYTAAAPDSHSVTDTSRQAVYGMPVKMAKAAVMAAEHLEDCGYPGLFDVPTCLAMNQLGQHDLAFECLLRTTGMAA
jgi:hypothetical protein